MRQAGRSLPGYREIRKRHSAVRGLPAARAVRRGDARAGARARRRRGRDVRGHHAADPRDGHRRRARRERRARDRRSRCGRRPTSRLCAFPIPEEAVPFILEAVRLVRAALAPEQALVGFCGGPFTVAGYLVEGKPTRDFVQTKRCMYGAPEVWHALMEKLTETSIAYLRAKVDGGRGRRPALRLLGRRAVAGRLCRVRRAVLAADPRGGRRPDDPFRHGHRAPARDDGRDRRRRDRARLARPARRGLGARGPRPRRAGEPRSGAPARAVRAGRVGGARDPRRGRRASGTHLQPRPRRAAGHGSGGPEADRRARSRTDRRTEARGRPHGLREPVRPRGHPSVPRGHPLGPAGLGRGRRGADRALPADRRALAARRRDRGRRARRLERELGFPVYVGHEALDAAGSPRPSTRRSRAAPTRSSGSFSRRTTRSSRSTATASGSRTPSTGAPDCGSSRAGTCTSRTWTCSPTACAAPTRMSSSRRTASRRGSSTWATRIATSCSRRRSLVAERAGLDSWSFAFQSASATGEPWLGPDILEELDNLHARGVERVLVCPIGFVSDHLEILWDIDVEARERAAELGLDLDRIESLNDDPGVHPRAGRAVPGGRWSTLDVDEPGRDLSSRTSAGASASTRSGT